MIGGVLVDLLLIAAVVAFAWGAARLGGISTLGRLAECVAAGVVAVLLRDPAGSAVKSFLGTSIDLSRLIGMALVALATYIAANSIFRWWRGRRTTERGVVEYDEPMPDPLDEPIVARIAGTALGMLWAVLFVALLVLQPASTPISRSAVASRIGGVIIAQERGLRWLNEGFPHYTQALPKGRLGAVVGEQRSLPMREPVEVKERAGDHDQLLRSVNALRRKARVSVLAFNPDIAAVARRHAMSLAEDRTLSYESPGGGSLDDRVRSALGESSDAFDDEVGIELVWARDPATAFRGLISSSRAQSELRDGRWSEIGIGVGDAGWFNGRIYVLLLVGHTPDDADRDGTDDGDVGATAAAGADEGDDDLGLFESAGPIEP